MYAVDLRAIYRCTILPVNLNIELCILTFTCIYICAQVTFIGVQPFPGSLCRMESQHVVKLPIQSFKDTFTFPQFLVFLFVLCAGNKAVEARTQITDW